MAGAAALISNGAPSRASEGSGLAAGRDLLPVVITANVESLLGNDRVVLTGWIEVERVNPRLEDGRSVVGLEVVQADLIGASRLGAVLVGERTQHASLGEIRALQAGAQFPASSFIDLFVDVSAPASTLGPIELHNEAPFHMALQSNGEALLLEAWPPLGRTYRYGAPIAGSGCIALLNPDNSVHDLDLCVRDITMDIAPLLPSFSVARGGPRHLHPADVLALAPAAAEPGSQSPYVRLTCAALGLSADGCDDGSDGDQDDIDALSYGNDMASGGPVFFSVGPGAQGRPGTGVEGQRLCAGLEPEPEPDVFSSSLGHANVLLLDGNGPIGSCTPAFPLGFVEGFNVRDDLDALDARDPSFVDGDGDGVPEGTVYLSLDAASPTLGQLGFSGADILKTSGSDTPSLYAPAAALGLGPGDDLDALCLGESGDGVFGEGDRLYFSLAAGSPSLAATGAGPGDLLAAGPLRVVARAAALGLAPDDEIDAVACDATLEGATGDANCDGSIDSIDASLVLQYNSGLIEALPCMGGADADGNGGVDSVDAALILQFHAGLIARLPPPEAGGR